MKPVLFGILSICLSAVLLAQDPFTLSVDVDMVLFNVSVLDNRGRLVTGLSKDQFKLFEDGREQTIHTFHPEDSPATVGLIIDNSGSMGRKRTAVVNAALTFLEESNPADEIFIVNFNEHVWMGLPAGTAFSSDRNQLENTLMATRAIGRTALYDAIAKGLSHLEQGTRQRKALVVLSDGGDTASTLDVESATELIRKSNATVYTIGIYDPFARDKNPGVLKDLAKSGGGEAYIPRQLTELPDIWAKIANGIRGQYTIGYFSNSPKSAGEFRKVKIVVTGKDGKALKVRTREGYVAGPARTDSQ